MAAVVNMNVRGVSPDALREMGLGMKTMVGKTEAKLCESWPMGFGLPCNCGQTSDISFE